MAKSRSIKDILELTQKKRGVRNPAAIITKDAESELSSQSIPDPKKTAQDIKSLVDTFGGEGKTDELLGKLGGGGDLIKGLFKI